METGLDEDSFYSEDIDRDTNEFDFDPHIDNPASFNSLNRQFGSVFTKEPTESRQVINNN
jgi:hypothetical protein